MSSRPTKNLLRRFCAALSIMVIIMGIYLFTARSYQLHWGATADEIKRPMPGDELDKQPTFLATRAVTINAGAATVWPWLVQMGFNRGGFYGYDIVEGIGSKSGMLSAGTVRPELQHIKVGDRIPISLVAETKLYAIAQNRYLIWAESDADKANGGFTWGLYPVDSTHTRLVSRIRWSHHWTKPGLLSLELFTEFTDHLAVRKILKGIKGRAEGRKPESMLIQSLEFFAYLVIFLVFFTSMIRLLWYPLSKRRYLICLLSGILWLTVWYA